MLKYRYKAYEPGVKEKVVDMAIWQYGNMAIWQYGNMAIWQYGNMAIWQYGNMAIWQLTIVVSGIQAGFWVSTKKTVINTLNKKENGLIQVYPNIQKMELGTGTIIHVGPACQEAEIVEQWSYVFKRSNQLALVCD